LGLAGVGLFQARQRLVDGDEIGERRVGAHDRAVQIDAFGNQSSIEYDDYSLLVTSVTDPLLSKTSVTNHYRLLQPWLLTDRLSRIRQWFSYWLKDEKPQTATTSDGAR